MNTVITNRYKVDALVNQFWKNGYLTVSRKFGTYLPAPRPIGEYEVDVIAKYNKKMAIGVTLGREDLESDEIQKRLRYLSTRHTKYSKKDVKLFVGVPHELLTRARFVVSELGEEYSQNIKLVPIPTSSMGN